MERSDPDETRLRIARYLDTPPRRPAPEPPEVVLPNIADYWPDAPHRQRALGWRAFVPGAPESGPPGEPPARRWRRRPVLLAGTLALAVIGGSVVLARPLANSDIRRIGALPAPIVPAESTQVVIPLEPSPPPAPSSVLTTTPVRASSPPTEAAPLQGGFELLTGVTDLVVRTADLDGRDFTVSGPADGVFTGGVLRLSGKANAGNDPVEVRLSDARVWQLRTGAGSRSVTLDLGAGTVSRINLEGGAERIDITLGRLGRTLPIRMGGGVSTWRIRTAKQVPVKVAIGSGAGDVVLYGQHSGGVGAGATLRSGDLDDAAGLDIIATGGLGNLAVVS
ncbi:hypothetical protein [Actinoplanes sp. L3-i22]|uniref:hypothetical protein n=1 Tax=Actinoplanes sp. L3-i22 TaxID=2836373 RepID=UPI001C77AB0F|nr:hypothetical protein [Actinoplanes sp. L3-i22]BCY10520.1 hypothetical protein L3i22_056080 [Actinoplanes sp. L3-i22]